MVAKLCERIQLWVDELPIGMVNEAKLLPIQPIHNKSIIYNYQDQFPITFKAGREKTYINATQMAKSFNKSPHVWLSTASAQEFREAMVTRGESESLESQIFSSRGRMGATWIEENLAIEFARWLSPDFSAWCNAKVKELVNDSCSHPFPRHQQGRRGEPSMNNFTVPQTFDEALQLAANQARQIRENEHKVSFYDQLVEMRESFKSTRIA
ncbi:MAG: KilA-N domain-containing protein, partial [Rikenellaceae bacterium]